MSSLNQKTLLLGDHISVRIRHNPNKPINKYIIDRGIASVRFSRIGGGLESRRLDP
jgi:hypothetical protein